MDTRNGIFIGEVVRVGRSGSLAQVLSRHGGELVVRVQDSGSLRVVASDHVTPAVPDYARPTEDQPVADAVWMLRLVDEADQRGLSIPDDPAAVVQIARELRRQGVLRWLAVTR
jgi:hypothetical protein